MTKQNQTSQKTIAFVIGSLSSGGAERVITNLSNTLIARYNILIITFSRSTPFYPLDERVKVVECRETKDTPTSMFQSLKLNFHLTRQVYKFLKAEQVDLSIGFITSANIITTIASKFYRIPCIISERNNPLVEEVPKFWVFLRNVVYPLADQLILQTKGVKELYERKVKPQKMIILPNPISSRLSTLRDKSVTKEKTILTVGRLDKSKCQGDLIKAFSALDLKGWTLIIIGDGNKKEELQSLIDDFGLTDRIKIISKVKHIEKFYNIASIFAFTSKNEGFPNALLEAMHFGIATVSYDCDFGPSDIIEDNVNGFLVPVNNVKILKEKLLKLITDEDLRSEFSFKAIASTEPYKSEFVVSKWESLIENIINK